MNSHEESAERSATGSKKTPSSTSRTQGSSEIGSTLSVKKLLGRWEVSSITGTPLHPEMESLPEAGGSAPPPHMFSTVKRAVHFSTSPPTVKSISAGHEQSSASAVHEGEQRSVSTAPQAAVSEDSSSPLSLHIDLLADIDKGLKEQQGVSAAGDGGGEGEEEQDASLSVSTYRKISLANRKTAQDPSASRSPSPRRLQRASPIADIISLPPEDFDQEVRVKRLRGAMASQQKAMGQARKALGQCRDDEAFHGSMQQIDAERALLLAKERFSVLQAEHEESMVRIANAPPLHLPRLSTAYVPKGTLSIDRLAVQLSKPFLRAAKKNRERYYLMGLLKLGELVVPTHLACTQDREDGGVVELVTRGIQLSGLHPDFKFTIELYGLRTYSHIVIPPVKKEGRFKWLRFLKQSCVDEPDVDQTAEFSPDYHSTPSPPSPSPKQQRGASSQQRPIVDPGFQRVGRLPLKSTESTHQTRFKLSDPVYPLEGTLHARMRYSIYLHTEPAPSTIARSG